MSAICKADFGTSDLDFPSSDNSVSASQQGKHKFYSNFACLPNVLFDIYMKL